MLVEACSSFRSSRSRIVASATSETGLVPLLTALTLTELMSSPVTLNPAWQLGIDQRVGSIEVGKDADIAIFSAHPFTPDARVEQTLVDGVVYFDRAKDLAARAAPAAKAGGSR